MIAMHNFEFKYERTNTAENILLFNWFLGLFAIIHLRIPFMTQFRSIIFVFLIIHMVMGLVGLLLRSFLPKGVGAAILHDNFTELKLNDIEHKIEYTEIEKIAEKKFVPFAYRRYWRIHFYNNKPTLILRQTVGSRKNDYCQLEHFMLELRKRIFNARQAPYAYARHTKQSTQ